MVPTFKIADAFVEVHAKTNDRSMKRATRSLSIMGPIVSTLTADIVGLTAASFSLASSLGYSTVALGAAIPAAVGLGGSMLVLKMLFKDTAGTPMQKFTDGLKDINKELTRSVQNSKPVKEGFDTLLVGLNKALPVTRSYVLNLAASIGLAAGEIGRLLSNAGFLSRLESLFRSSGEAMSYVARMADSIVDIFVTLGAAAGPVLVNLVRWLDEVTSAAQRWVLIKYETGELTAMFTRAGNEAALWAKTLGNFLLGLVAMFRAAHETGTTLAGSLYRISDAFKEWARSADTQAKIRDVLNWIVNIDWGTLHKIAGGVLAIVGAFRVAVGIQSVIGGLLSLLSLGPVGLLLTGLAAAIALVAGALAMAGIHSEQFRNAIGGALQQLASIFLPVLEKLGPLLASLADSLIALLVPAVQMLIAKFIELSPMILDLAIRFGTWLLPILAQILPIALSFFVLLIERGVPALVTIGEWVLKVAMWMQAYLMPVLAVVKLYWDAFWQVLETFVIPLLKELWIEFETKIFPALIRARDNLLPMLIRAFQILSTAWKENKTDLLELFEKFKVLFGFIIERGIPILGSMIGLFSIGLAIAIRIILGLAADLNRLLKWVADNFTMLKDTALFAIDKIKDGLRGLIDLLGKVGNLPGVNQLGGAARQFFGRAHGGIVGGAATGGVRSGFTMVGEAGPELVRLPAGARVRSNPDTRRILGGGSGGQSGAYQLVVAPGADGAVATMIMQLVRSGQIQLQPAGAM